MIPDNQLARGIQSKSVLNQKIDKIYFFHRIIRNVCKKESSNSEQAKYFAPNLITIFLYTFQMILSPRNLEFCFTKKCKKIGKLFLHTFQGLFLFNDVQGKKMHQNRSKKNMLGGLRPQAPDAFGLNPPGQLVIGYHWLAFLNQVLKQLKRPCPK